jgi:hypothetical protein
LGSRASVAGLQETWMIGSADAAGIVAHHAYQPVR